MADILDVEGCWERFEFVRTRHLRNQLLWVHIQFTLFYPRAQIQVQTALESLIYELVIERDMPDLVKFLGHKVCGFVQFVHLLPLFQLLLGEKVLFWRIVALVVGW